MLRLLCLLIVAWPAWNASLTFTLTSQDFQKKKVKVKRTNLEYFSHYGLMLRDRNQPGRLESEPIELPPGTFLLVMQWGSSLPPDGLTISVQVSPDGNTWSQWFTASEQVRLDRRSNLYAGGSVSGFGQARYMRYRVEIKPEPPPIAPGCLALIDVISATADSPRRP